MIKNFIEKNTIEYYEDASLKKYNTYRVDAKCKYIVIPKDRYEFKDLVKNLSLHDEKFLVLGNGSNVIFAFDYYDGVVILLNKLNELRIDGESIYVEAGYSLQRLAIDTSSLGLEGLEFATGIPGLVGASVAMNAGAYNSSLSEIVTDVLVLNPEFQFDTMTRDELKFKYRDSFFKRNPDALFKTRGICTYIHECQCELYRAVKKVQEAAPFFKHDCLVLILGKLIVDVLELYRL